MCGSLEGIHPLLMPPIYTGTYWWPVKTFFFWSHPIFISAMLTSFFSPLCRLCIVFLTFSCIGYAMPFILCSMICCCLPCIISILGVRDDVNGMRGATEEIINALPTHKFKSKEKESHSSRDSNSGVEEGGFLAAGTERERVISGEDAVSSSIHIHEIYIVWLLIFMLYWFNVLNRLWGNLMMQKTMPFHF